MGRYVKVQLALLQPDIKNIIRGLAITKRETCVMMKFLPKVCLVIRFWGFFEVVRCVNKYICDY